MSSIKKVGTKVQIEIDRFDGGLNTKDAPPRIAMEESPDCLNVVYDDQGAVSTREGTSYFNTSVVETGSNVIDGLTQYQQTMVAWGGGDMFRSSGTTFVTIPEAQGQFASGVKVAYEQFQDILFCSDGTNGPWRYEGDESFYRMGVPVPSAPTGASNVAGDIAADNYYYAVSYVNSHAVESEAGSGSVAVSLSVSAVAYISSIPTGDASHGVASRNIYRATSAAGPWLYVGALANNTASFFTDTLGVGSEGSAAPSDATAPTPFTTIKLHRDRLFFDDSSNRTLLRYTEHTNPFVSQVLSFVGLRKGDGSVIQAVSVQDDLVTIFKDNSAWVVACNDPSNDATWTIIKTPANLGIVGPRAFVETDNGIFFCGKRSGFITGFHLLSGIDVLETNNALLRTRSISEKIETDVLAWPKALWEDIAMGTYQNRIYIAAFEGNTSTETDAIYWFDINRLGTDGQPGSWSPWTGVVGVTDFTVFDGEIYGGSSTANGYVLQFNNGTYTDADGSAVDSYMWTKEFGGSASIESWIKDWRWINLWYDLVSAAEFMNLSYRAGGDTGAGTTLPAIDLNPGGAVWDTGVWGTAVFGGASRTEKQFPIGGLNTRRVQFKFDNQNTAGQRFKVYSLKTLCNLRRQR